MPTKYQPNIYEEYGSRESRDPKFFDYHAERYKAYLLYVPSFIPERHKDNVARRIANKKGLIVNHSVDTINQRNPCPNLSDYRDSIQYDNKYLCGYEWILSVTSDPPLGEVNVGESEFAVTSGDRSTFQTNVGECLGITMIDRSGEILSVHTYPIFFEEHKNWEGNVDKIKLVCEMYLYQINLIWSDLNPRKIILNSQMLGNLYNYIFKDVLEERYKPDSIEAYKEAHIEYVPKEDSVYALSATSSDFNDLYKRYILVPERERKLTSSDIVSL